MTDGDPGDGDRPGPPPGSAPAPAGWAVHAPGAPGRDATDSASAGSPAATPPSPTGWSDPELRRERLVAVVVAVVIGLSALAVAARPGSASGPRRTLPRASNGHVLIVPIGAVPDVAAMAQSVAAEYHLDIQVAPAIAAPPSAFDVARNQYASQDLIGAMVSAHPASGSGAPILVALTSSDMYIRGVDWNWAFAEREAGRLVVISTARMTSLVVDRGSLTRKMLVRELGFVCFQLAATSDPRDLMFQDVLSVDDLIRMDDHL
jgi:predicted Zn-dependent protease